MTSSDAVEIDTACKADQPITLKSLIALWACFMLVVSDMFVNSILSKFAGATFDREPTTIGIFVMSLCLVIMYTLALYLIKQDIL